MRAAGLLGSQDRPNAGSRQWRSAAERRRRRSRRLAIAISAAGVTTRVSTVAKPRPNTMAVERLIHHCVAGAPSVISRERNSIFIPNAIGSTPRIAVTAVRTTGRALAARLDDRVVSRHAFAP